MKQTRIILAMLIAVLMIAMTGCTEKEPITADTFKEICKSQNLTVKDVSKNFSDDDSVESALTAKSKDGWQIEFYVLGSEHDAIGMFNTYKAEIEKFKSNSFSESNSSLTHSASYTLTSGGQYMHVCRIENTLLYVNEPKEHANDIKAVLKELGY